MDGFAVTVEHLGVAGDAGRAVGAVVRGVDLAGPVGFLAGALPGGAVAAQAVGAGRGFAAVLGAVADAMVGQANRITAAAAEYAAADRAATTALTSARGG
ncbi:MAG: hypothetical protein LH603_06905 [Pseudonocardia sp.]|nr:hypothetical protein [Pseudonocardia sp.]